MVLKYDIEIRVVGVITFLFGYRGLDVVLLPDFKFQHGNRKNNLDCKVRKGTLFHLTDAKK